MQDKLDEIFRLQNELNTEIREKRHLEYTSSEWIQKETLAVISELSEVLDEVNFKWWKNPRPVDDSRVKEEIIDIVHFLVSMCLDAGMTADELFQIYTAKHRENLDRQHGKSAKPGYSLEDAGK